MRHVLAVALVAVALAADETVAVAGSSHVQRGAESRSLVSRLTIQLRGAVAGSMIQLVRQDRVRPSVTAPLIQVERPLGFGYALLEPFEQRMPPPLA